MGNLNIVERYTFPVIENVLAILRKADYQFSSGDSLLVRAYTPYKRDLEDLDLIFKPGTNFYALQEFILQEISNVRMEDPVIIHLADNTIGGFLRIRIPIGITYNRENYFIIDFHVGGSVNKGVFASVPDEAFYNEIKWLTVKSASELEELAIPTPSLEEVLLFKISKFIGKDKHDIISLLTTESIGMDVIKERYPAYQLRQQNGIDMQRKLETLLMEFDTLIDQWNYYHFTHLQKRKILIAEKNLKQLKKAIHESHSRG